MKAANSPHRRGQSKQQSEADLSLMWEKRILSKLVLRSTCKWPPCLVLSVIIYPFKLHIYQGCS